MTWKCQTCSVANKPEFRECVCCGTVNELAADNADVATPAEVAMKETTQHTSENDQQNILQQVSKIKLVDSQKSSTYIWGSGDCDQFSHMRDTYELGLPKIMKYNAKDIAVGSLHSALITTTGSLVTWGCNDEGALGHEGQHPKKLRFKQVIDRVVCGDTMTAVLLENGHLMITGCFRDTNGLLGITIDGTWYEKTNTFKLIATGVLLMSCGTNHIIYLTREGLFSIGSNEFGQMGLGFNYIEERDNDKKRKLLEPQAVGFRKHKDIVHLSCGAKTSFIFLKSGIIYGCGMSGCGELGKTQSTIDTFTKLPAFYGATRILGGEFHTLMYKSNDQIYGCGQRECLGLPNSREKRTTGDQPEQVFSGLDIKEISIGMGQIFGINKDGVVYCAGKNLSGELTETLPEIVDKPTVLPNDKLFGGARIEYIVAGSMHSVAFIKANVYQRAKRITKKPNRLQLPLKSIKTLKSMYR